MLKAATRSEWSTSAPLYQEELNSAAAENETSHNKLAFTLSLVHRVEYGSVSSEADPSMQIWKKKAKEYRSYSHQVILS